MNFSINVYDLKCIACGFRCCYACEKVSHFPALCSENNWWNERTSVTDMKIRLAISNTERELSSLDDLMTSVADLKQDFEEEVFNSHSHLPYMIDEMEMLIELLRWMKNSLQNLYVFFSQKHFPVCGLYSRPFEDCSSQLCYQFSELPNEAKKQWSHGVCSSLPRSAFVAGNLRSTCVIRSDSPDLPDREGYICRVLESDEDVECSLSKALAVSHFSC